MKYFCIYCGSQNKPPEALTKNEPCKCGCYVIENERDIKNRIKMGNLDPKKFTQISV